MLLLLHIVTAAPYLALGAFLFVPQLRNLTFPAHRVAGSVYVFTVLVSALPGFVLACANPHGAYAKLDFATLSVVWFTTTFIAWRKMSIDRDWVAHLRWMIRSYAISLAVTTVRFLREPIGMTAAEWYPIMTWICWVPNVLVAEAYVCMTDPKGRLRLPTLGIARAARTSATRRGGAPLI